jgi:hypothetical protein
MQMRRNYESTNKLARIVGLKQAAAECALKGFPGFAAVCEEHAKLLQDELNAAEKAARKAERVEVDTDPEFIAPRIDGGAYTF